MASTNYGFGYNPSQLIKVQQQLMANSPGTTGLSGINPYLDKGWSYEDISRDTGFDINSIRSYADRTRPGYGVPPSVQGVSTDAPNRTSGGGGSYTDNAYYNDQEALLRDLLGQIGTTRTQGLAQLGDSYNQTLNRTNEQQGQALRDYGVKREDTQRDRLGAYNQVDTNARTLNDSVRRILGLAGSSGSSAAKLAAPNAIAREASGRRAQVTDQYGRNLRNIDTAESDTKLSFENALADLLSQKRDKEREFLGGLLQQEQGVYGDLADIAAERAQAQGGGYGAVRTAQAPYRTEITNRQQALAGLFDQYRNPTYNVNPVNVKTPELGQYTVDKATINQQGGGNIQGDYSPYAAFLRRRQQGTQ